MGRDNKGRDKKRRKRERRRKALAFCVQKDTLLWSYLQAPYCTHENHSLPCLTLISQLCFLPFLSAMISSLCSVSVTPAVLPNSWITLVLQQAAFFCWVCRLCIHKLVKKLSLQQMRMSTLFDHFHLIRILNILMTNQTHLDDNHSDSIYPVSFIGPRYSLLRNDN